MGAAKGEELVMQTMCCVCQKTKSQAGWIQGRAEKKGRVSHGYCPDCFHRIMERAQDWLPAGNGGQRVLTLGR